MTDGEQSTTSSSGAASSEPAKGSVSIPGAGLANSQWPATVAQGIDDVLNTVHDKAIRPLLLITRSVVYGILVLSMAVMLMLFFAIAVIRILTVYAFGHRVWPAYALVGAVLALGGLFAWTKRSPRESGGT
jgi:VIT1/CCC1 family predicted Fe2+/Mn2+ transporter